MTPQQKASHPEKSIWVEASAGTGKTKVLIDRLLSLLLLGVPLDKILCLTYTKAAALEMTERLVARLDQWAIIPDAALKTDMMDLGLSIDNMTIARSLRADWYASPHGIDIQTIHSFCQKILNTFPIEAGVTPYFQVMDATAIHQGFQKAIVQAASENTRSLNVLLMHRTWQSIQDILLSLFSERYKWHARGGQEKIISAFEKDLSLSCQPIRLSDLMLPNVQDIIVSLEQEGVRAQKIGSALDVFHVSSKTSEDFLSLADAFLTQKETVRKSFYPKKWGESHIKWSADLTSFAEKIRDITVQQKKEVLKDYSVHMATLFSKALDIYTAWKQVQGRLDYDDLIFKTKTLLEDAPASLWVGYKLDMDIDHVLVDEAQDTNPVQWAIIKKITGDFFHCEQGDLKRSLFVVGDAKQSIFSFQGAHMDTFQGTKRVLMSENDEIQTVNLTTSFRTTGPILEFVDALFSRHKHLGDVPPHVCHRKGQGGIVAFWPLMDPPEKIFLKPWQVADKPFMERSAQTRLAEYITEKIQDWLTKGRLLSGTNRPVQPKDIMILVRKRDAFVSAMIRALKTAGISVHGDEKILLNEHIFIQDMQALSDFLLLPQNDMALALVLKSPLVGMSEDDLFELSYNRPGYLWHALKKRGQITGTIYHTAHIFLSHLLNKVGYKTPYDFYMLVLYKHKKFQAYLARMGTEVNGVIEAFLDILGKTPLYGMDIFWQEFKAANHMIARPMEDNAVRIMTVHGAKGLQAPIVIMPDTTQIPRPTASFFWTKNSLACLPKALYGVPEIEILQEHQKEDQLGEYYRLLYVAMTRAEEELYISGWRPISGVSEGSWYSLLLETSKAMSNFQEGIWNMVGSRREALLDDIEQGERGVSLNNFDAPPKPVKISGQKEQKSKETIATKEGIYTHTLLENLVDMPLQYRPVFMKKFIDENDLPVGALEAIENLLNDSVYKHIVSLPHQVEMPIVGDINGEAIKRYIDFCALDVVQRKIYILEYKTVRKDLFGSREKDKEQINNYKEILSIIYPDYEIKGIIIYINIIAGTFSWED